MKFAFVLLTGLVSFWANAQVVSGEHYQILSSCGSGTAAVSVENGSLANGARLVAQNLSSTAWVQQFRFDHLGSGIYRIVSRHSGKTVDVNNYSYNDGTPVILWDYFAQDNQKFRLASNGDGTVSLFAVHSGKAFDLQYSNPNPGTLFQQWQPNGSCAQKFRLRPVSSYKNPYSVIQAESFDSQTGIQVDDLGRGNSGIGSTDQGDQITYRGFDFQDGAQSMNFRIAVAPGFGGKRIQIRLGNGQIVGEAITVSTGGWSNFQNLNFNLSTRITGIQDFTLNFLGNAVGVLDSFQFSKSSMSSAPPPPTTTTTTSTTTTTFTTTTLPPSTGSRWSPGFYLQASAYPSRNGIDLTEANTIANSPYWQGIQVTVRWGVTETSMGDYRELYKTLDQIRDWCRSSGKKAMIRLFERSFEGNIASAPFPQYIRDTGAWYDRNTLAYLNNGMAVSLSTPGENIVAPKLWDPFVRERLIQWAEKVAEYAAVNPEIVMIQTEEYSTWGGWRLPDYNPTGIKQLWRDFARRVTAKAGTALVHINTGWSVDYMNLAANQAELAELTKYPIVLGPTDLRKDNEQGSATLSTDFGAFMFNWPTQNPAGYRGVHAFVMSYEWPDYSSVESPAEHFRWASDDLGVQFIVIDPDKSMGSGGPRDWRYDQARQAVEARRGLTNTARPSRLP